MNIMCSGTSIPIMFLNFTFQEQYILELFKNSKVQEQSLLELFKNKFLRTIVLLFLKICPILYS